MTVTCDGGSTDFVPGEGIRIVGAADAPRTPAIQGSPVVTRQGASTGAGHTYCYIVFTADALGGISEGSLPACIADEPDNLSYTGTYNALTTSYNGALPALLWYRSKDGGEYNLISINGPADVGQDVGQAPRDHGGWSAALPPNTLDIHKQQDLFATVLSTTGNTVNIDTPLHTSVSGALVDHDDTAAFQASINAGVSAGGAIIHVGNGTFNIRRPMFQYKANSGDIYPSYTTNYSAGWLWSTWWYLCVPNFSPGNIHFIGNGSSSVIQLPPEYAGPAVFLGVGTYGHPAYLPFKATPIEEVDKGATSLQLTNLSDASALAPGTDIWLYTGTFGGDGTHCTNSNGTAGGNCHFSELNTVTAVNGRTLELAYPTSKKYYDDGADSFGLVVLPPSTHNISIEDLTFNSSNRFFYGGFIYGLVINNITIHGTVSRGVFGQGAKRDVLIENSTWEFGGGDASWLATDEFDQSTDVAFIHNHITGVAAPGAEGPSLMARLYMTEGTSEVSIVDNTFDHVSVSFQDTTDDIIDMNTFTDGAVAIGRAYVPESYVGSLVSTRNFSFVSFASSQWALVTRNTFSIDASFYLPWAIYFGHFKNGEVSGNIVNGAGGFGSAAIISSGGKIDSNQLNLQYESPNYVAVRVVPDEAPNAPFSGFDIKKNTISGNKLGAGIGIVGLTISDPAPVCLEGNIVEIGTYPPIYIWNPVNVHMSCNE